MAITSHHTVNRCSEKPSDKCQYPTQSSQAPSSGSSYISDDWTPQRRSRHVWWHTQSVNQLKSRCQTHKRLTKRCMEWHEASMHDKQHVSITQQPHRHQWSRDLSLVKRDRRVYGSFSLWIMRIITQRGVFATDMAQLFVWLFVQSWAKPVL